MEFKWRATDAWLSCHGRTCCKRTAGFAMHAAGTACACPPARSSLPLAHPSAPQPKPEEPRNPLPLATQQYVRMALHSAVHNTR